jgi:hypothetical protein
MIIKMCPIADMFRLTVQGQDHDLEDADHLLQLGRQRRRLFRRHPQHFQH